jgi:hypothetical protein
MEPEPKEIFSAPQHWNFKHRHDSATGTICSIQVGAMFGFHFVIAYGQ